MYTFELLPTYSCATRAASLLQLHGLPVEASRLLTLLDAALCEFSTEGRAVYSDEFIIGFYHDCVDCAQVLLLQDYQNRLTQARRWRIIEGAA